MFHQRFQRPRFDVCPTLRHGMFSWVLISVILLVGTRGLAQQNDLRQVAVSLARDINAGNRHTITVADFTDLQGNVTELGRFISEELSTQLVIDAKSFTVVERLQLAAILKEHQISVSGLVDPSTIRKLGQFTGVDAIVTGTLVPFSDSVRLTAKVLDVSTAKMMAVSTADLPRTKAIDDLLSRGIATVALTGQSNPGPSPSASRPPEPLSIVQEDYLLLIKNCARRGDRILCSGAVTNKADKPRGFVIRLGGGETTAVDNNGTSYVADQAHVGKSDGEPFQQLMADLPVNFFLTFSGVDITATKISVVLAFGSGDYAVIQSKALFRNIPLAQK